jgi:hypothetical protein
MQQMWLENEGAIVSNLVPVRKTTSTERGKGTGRHSELHVGEAFCRWDRSCGIPILREHVRYKGKLTQAIARNLRSLRLTRTQRDQWDVFGAQIEREVDIHNAKMAMLAARTPQERADAYDRLAELEPDPEWFHELEEQYEAAAKGAVSVVVPR